MRYRCPFGCRTAIITIKPGAELDYTNDEYHFIPCKLDGKAIVAENGPVGTDGSATAKSTGKLRQVESAWDFDNVGVSKHVEGSGEIELTTGHGEKKLYRISRLLVCGACDQGPVGFAGLPATETPKENPNELDYFACIEY